MDLRMMKLKITNQNIAQDRLNWAIGVERRALIIGLKKFLNKVAILWLLM